MVQGNALDCESDYMQPMMAAPMMMPAYMAPHMMMAPPQARVVSAVAAAPTSDAAPTGWKRVAATDEQGRAGFFMQRIDNAAGPGN
jgi:hypothetical protein